MQVREGDSEQLQTPLVKAQHLHPSDPVFRLLLDDLGAIQRVGDVIEPSPLGLKPHGHVAEVHAAAGGLLHQPQEAAGQQVQRRPWTNGDITAGEATVT